MVRRNLQDLESSFCSSVTVGPLDKSTRVDQDGTRRPARTTLRFDLEHNQIIWIAHRDDTTEAEKQSSYFSEAELSEMKRETRRMARWWKGSHYAGGDGGDTIRGMESLIYHEVTTIKKASRRSAASAVFLEQEMARDYAHFHPLLDQTIAAEYNKFTAAAQQRAYQLGRQDAYDAGIYSNEAGEQVHPL
jgi:hypothetical protein